VLDKFQPAITAQLLFDASKQMDAQETTVVVDGGVENFNSAVDEVINTGLLKRVLAQTEIRSSNSMIESWWRVLKHQWLYINQMDSLETVGNLVEFYVSQHNSHLPHSAFRGQPPDEMYFGTGNDVPEKLEAARQTAQHQRLTTNRSLSCKRCEDLVTIEC